MLSPALAYVILLVGVPFVLAILLSFSSATAGSLTFNWAGFRNYTTILADPIFLRSLSNTAIVTIGSQVLVVVLATAAAQVFRATFHGKRAARFVLLLPWAVPVSLSRRLPGVAAGVSFGGVSTATDLAVVLILAGGAPAGASHVLPALAFVRGVVGAALGQGAAIAVFLLPFLIAVAVLLLRFA